MQEVIEALNKAQQDAVKHIDGPLLILAGAGSGKTKTLTTRLAYLIAEVGIDPLNTLTLTFTTRLLLRCVHEHQASFQLVHPCLFFVLFISLDYYF